MSFDINELNDNKKKIDALIKRTKNPLIKNMIKYGYNNAIKNTVNNQSKRFNGGPHHKVVDLEYHGNKVKIDTKIAPLISELWKAGINTSNSCEDNVPANFVWVEFPGVGMHNFMTILSVYGGQKSDIYNHIVGNGSDMTDWIYSTNVHDMNEDNDSDSDTDDFDAKIYMSVRFPIKDLNEVYALVKQSNDEKNSNDEYKSLTEFRDKDGSWNDFEDDEINSEDVFKDAIE
jgi:hypothetical protein